MTLRISSHKVLDIPKISSELMLWRNRLCTKKSRVSFSLGDPKVTFTTRIYLHHLDLRHYNLGLLIEINRVPASIWLTSWPMEKHLESFLSGKKLSQLPVDLRAELLEATYKPLLSAITFHTNTQVRVLNFLNLKPGKVNASSLGLSLRDNVSNQESNMVILMHDKLQPVMEKLLAYWPNKTDDFWYNTNAEMWLQAGEIELSLEELTQLEPSDILVIVTSGAKDQISLRLGSGEFFNATIQSNQLILDSGVQKMADDINDQANDETIASVEEIPVRLTFDLGDLVMPFKDVQSLTQGSTIDLNIPITHAVTIRSLNRVIGTGELVDIDGHMGVRIVKLFSKKTVGENSQVQTTSAIETTNG